MKRRERILRRARRSFLQTACGVLFAWMGGVSIGLLPVLTAWRAALFTLIAAAAGGFAAGIHQIEE